MSTPLRGGMIVKPMGGGTERMLCLGEGREEAIMWCLVSLPSEEGSMLYIKDGKSHFTSQEILERFEVQPETFYDRWRGLWDRIAKQADQIYDLKAKAHV